MTSQKGSAHVIIIVGLVVLLAGSLGFIFWQNFIDKEQTATTSQVSRAQDTTKEDVQLPDMITYEPEIQIVSAEEINKLKDAPESFKKFIAGSIGESSTQDKTEPGSDCFSVFTVNKIYKQKYATGGVSAGGGCVGGAAVLWGIIDGNWTDISGTQNIGFSCEDLELHKVPAAIAGSTCYDPESPGGARAYSQE